MTLKDVNDLETVNVRQRAAALEFQLNGMLLRRSTFQRNYQHTQEVISQVNVSISQKVENWREKDEDVKEIEDCGWVSEEFIDSDSEEDEDFDEKEESGKFSDYEYFDERIVTLAKISTAPTKDTSMRGKSLKSKKKVRKSLSDFIDVNFSEAKHPPPALPPEPIDLSGWRLKRRKVVESLVSSENSYVQTLVSLVEDFEKPLLSMAPNVLPIKHLRVIFYQIREILQCHRMFQIAMNDAISNWDSKEQLGACFVASFGKSTVLKCYSLFINNYPNAVDRIRSLVQTKNSFCEFLTQRQLSSTHKMPLLGLLIKPIQRFPQFLLMLKDLIKYTEEDHIDRLVLQQALTVLDSLTNQLNDRKRETDQRKSAREMLKKLHLHYRPKSQKRFLRCILDQEVFENQYDACTGNFIAKIPRRLLLMNELLLCLSNPSATEAQPKLLWAAPLQSVKISRTNITPDLKVTIQGSTITSNSQESVPEELREAYSELQKLIHDFAVISRLSGLASTLHYSYDEISDHNLQFLSRNLQLAIQQRDEQIKLLKNSNLSLEVTLDGNKAMNFVLDVGNASKKVQWTTALMEEKLRSDPVNKPAWFSQEKQSDSDENTLNSKTSQLLNTPSIFCQMPLFIDGASADITRNFESLVCGVPVCLAYGQIVRRYLWCCTADGIVTVLSIRHETPEVTESFRCQEDSAVECDPKNCVVGVELVPGQPHAKWDVLWSDSVWMVRCNGQVDVHSLDESNRRFAALRFMVSNYKSEVRSLCYVHTCGCLLIGHKDGYLTVYRIADITSRNQSVVESRYLGNGPVNCIRLRRNLVLVTCGSIIFKLMDDTLLPAAANIDLQAGGAVRHLVVCGSGLWLNRAEHPHIIQLWHAELGILLQELYLEPVIRHHKQKLFRIKLNNIVAQQSNKKRLRQQQECESVMYNTQTTSESLGSTVTCMTAVRGTLWIGTEAGWLLAVQLPRLVDVTNATSSGLPMADSTPVVSTHAHCGPVQWLLPFQNIEERIVNVVEMPQVSNYLSEERFSESFESESTEENTNFRYGALRRSSQSHLKISSGMQKWLSTPNLFLNNNKNTITEEEDIGCLYSNLMNEQHYKDVEEDEYENDIIHTRNEAEDNKIKLFNDNDEGKLEEVEEVEEVEAVEENLVAEKEEEEMKLTGPLMVISCGKGYVDLNRCDEAKFSQEACVLAWWCS